MKQSGVEVNAHVSYRGVGFFVYDCKVFGDTDECVYEVWSTLFYCLFGEIWTLTNYYQNKTLIRPNEKNYYLLNSGPIFYIMYS